MPHLALAARRSPTTPRASPTARPALAASGVLLSGVALVMLSSGLQGSLVSLRASMEAFPTLAIGIVMASFYLGFLGGTWWVPSVVQRVGHIRAFAALASLASATVLMHLLLVHPVSWSLVRLATGFCMAGLYVVAESWINDLATNETRGQLLGMYMLVSVAGLGGGQALLTVADPGGFKLFVLASVLVSVALVPVALSATPGPALEAPQPMSLRDVGRAVPLGLVGTVGAGVTHGAVLGMGTVYAQSVGLSVGATAGFLAASILGGLVSQLPLSRLSDRRDRRQVIAAASLLAGAAAVVAAVVAGSPVALLAAMGVLGMLSWPIYSLCVAHTNDWLGREQIVGAAATLVLASGCGAVAGPLLVSLAMGVIGPGGFFVVLAAAHVLIGAYALHRMTVRPQAPRQRPLRYVAWAARAATVASSLHPRTMARARGTARGRRAAVWHAHSEEGTSAAAEAVPAAETATEAEGAPFTEGTPQGVQGQSR